MGQDTVYPPVDPFQISDGLLIFLIRGQFLGPPGDTLYPEHLPCPSLEPIFLFKIGGRRVKDSILDIMGGCAAHREEGQSADLKDLPPHQVDHMRPDIVDLPAVPGVNRQSVQLIKVFVVSVYKKGRERPVFQPVEPVCLPGLIVPHAPEIAGDDRIVITFHLLLLGKMIRGEPLEAAVGVAGDIDHICCLP